jgi:H+-translocating NAD(P) transhydrogenase subunit beta
VRRLPLVPAKEPRVYAGIQNELFYGENCNMVYGDAAAVLTKMIEAMRGLGKAAA